MSLNGEKPPHSLSARYVHNLINVNIAQMKFVMICNELGIEDCEVEA